MRGNSRINRQQQVKVVIRLKPEQKQSRFSKCVYLSDQDENQLVVEANNKKQIFMFDYVAHQLITQHELYKMVAQECISQFFDGYNCCIFAYGQTGAGKTYSVLGSSSQMTSDPYADSRGILPRILQNIFQEIKDRQSEKHKITCSYMQIYNEQIFDLLSTDKRIHQIRQDAKKGVFIQGLSEVKVNSYRNALNLLLEGEKTRKISTTMMNNESSRSHVIFSILIQNQIIQEDVIKSKKAKMHIIDLAGSERVKHTNVQGERLRQGCNINKSLHVLSNVINSLLQSTKKKKHVPFRDSKLTHYLKDSLGGNSITKLLANIHTNKVYLGDTLSTLMFANRAKILKMKVEVNESTVQNFDHLRKEVRKLREELAQARYFKEARGSQKSNTEPNYDNDFDKIENVQIYQAPKNEVIERLQQNELHYKALIQIYEEHMKTCLSSSNFKRKQNINIVKEWKNLERRNISLTNLIKQLPSFAKIYKENLLLRQQRSKFQQHKKQNINFTPANHQQKDKEQNNNHISEKSQIIKPNQFDLQNIMNIYQKIISQMQVNFRQTINQLQKNYVQLQNQCKYKDKKIKEMRKKREYPPDIQQLKNQNQFLHLNILNLEDQIHKLELNEQIMKKNQLRSSNKKSRKVQSQQDLIYQGEQSSEIDNIYQKLLQIKAQALKQAQGLQKQRQQMQLVLEKVQKELSQYKIQNKKLQKKYNKSKSRRKRIHHKEETQSLCHAETFHDFQEEQHEVVKENNRSNTAKTSNFQNQSLKSLEKNYIKEMLGLKIDVKKKQKQIVNLKATLSDYMLGDKRIQDQFGKSIDQLIEQYRELSKRKLLQHSKSAKAIIKTKEIEPKQYNLHNLRQQRLFMNNFIPNKGQAHDKKEETKVIKKNVNTRFK